jgi:ubiquinone/menaquinone biosynthesis C-methylase UbiE
MGETEPPQPGIDWSVGRYETTAAQLAPAAWEVVRRASLQQGERVLDLGCGTGNAALLAARAGCSVTGVDPAARLLEVAHARAAAENVAINFLPGDAASIPLTEASVDVILSVFAVIFAPDPRAAAAEMSRVLSPVGRIVLSAWFPTGVIFEMNSVAAQTVMRAVGAPPSPPGFTWYDREALATLFGTHGFGVELEEHSLTFRARSVEDFLEEESRNHPMAVTGMAVLEELGQADELRERLARILTEGNEDPRAFQASSRYVVATLMHESAQA